MAQEELVIANLERELILPSRNEILAQKIQEFRKENRQKDEERILGISIERFCKCFVVLTYRFVNISRDQLSQFSIDELEVLSNQIAGFAYPWRIAQSAFFLIPLIGWVSCYAVCADPMAYSFQCYRYFYYLRKIKKLRGKDYFPSAELHEYLKKHH